MITLFLVLQRYLITHIQLKVLEYFQTKINWSLQNLSELLQ